MQAILRLGGKNLLIKAMCVKYIVLDNSLTDIITKLRINEIDIEELKRMLVNRQTNKEQQENRIQQLIDSLQKVEFEAQKQAIELFDHKDKFTKEILECKKEIKKTNNTIRCIQDEVIDKQNQVGDLTHRLVRLECKYNKKLKEIDGQLCKHDEQFATSTKDMEDIKKKQHDTADTSRKIGLVSICFMICSNTCLGKKESSKTLSVE